MRKMLLIADPGPDPDDTKVVIAAAMLHKRRVLRVEALVCNGGQQQLERTALARTILQHIGMASAIRVGVGEPVAKEPYQPKPHEYAIPGYGRALKELKSSPTRYYGRTLILQVLREAQEHSLTVQCQTGMTDLALVIEAEPELFKRKVCLCSIMGGLRFDGQRQQWEPDTAANNMFDLEAAKRVYSFCLEHQVPMHVVSRNAVPSIRMSLAEEFADDHRDNVVMRYLYDAQKLGLVGLWGAVCAKTLPPRCSKEWYFTTFCGVSKVEWEGKRGQQLERLGAATDIAPMLQGTVKPYDVVAFMSLLPDARRIFDFDRAAKRVNGTVHHFFLTTEQTVPLQQVEDFLSSIYSGAVAVGSVGGAKATIPMTTAAETGGSSSRRSRIPISKVKGGSDSAAEATGELLGAASKGAIDAHRP